jgi:acylphosphatase
MIRCTIVFTGRVQGVGFRATARDVADGFAVTGWVRNEPDGSVRCIVEGEKGEIERFVGAVRQTMSSFVRGVQLSESAATGEFKGFNIAR